MVPSLTESVRDLEVRHGIQFAESKRSTAGPVMGGTYSGVPRQRHECACMVQGKRDIGEDVLLLAEKAISANGMYDRSGKLRKDSPGGYKQANARARQQK